MFDIMAEKNPQAATVKNITIKQKAETIEELFINWLNELLSLSSAKNLIFSGFKINKLDDFNLQAIAVGEDIKNYKVNAEIKAATYHQLKLEKTRVGWQAEVIFDV